MKERIRRVTMLFRELGYSMEAEDCDSEAYAAGFISSGSSSTATEGGMLYIDRECRFLELSFSFMFSSQLTAFLQAQLPFIQDICYEFGCYTVVLAEDEDIIITIHSKIYYAGLNYFSLKETLRDLFSAVAAIEEQADILFDPDLEDDTYECS